MSLNRRGFLAGIIAAAAAPAIVRVASIMPVKVMPVDLMGDFTTDNLIVKATERYSLYHTDNRVFADLTEEALEAALRDIRSQVKDKGVVLSIRPTLALVDPRLFYGSAGT